MPRKATLGLDFGTESARALLADVETGEEIATAVWEYSDGVIDQRLPGTEINLPRDWALQNPADYPEALRRLVPQVLREAGVSPEQVIGIGVDFTACTMMPVDENRTPLCFQERFHNRPHAWTKLWKHHGAEREAARINELASARQEPFLARYGGKTSSEWLFAKIWQILNEDPEIYQAAGSFVEAGDWIVYWLTGREARSACQAGFKGFWGGRDGYPSREFLAALDPRLENVVQEKLSTDIRPVGTKAGELTAGAARELGLLPGTPVAVSVIDAHAAMPAGGVVSPGTMLMVLGTSSCHLTLGAEKNTFEGLAGVVEGGAVPGLFAYECGQSGTGDIFNWFVRTSVPPEYHEEAKSLGISVHELLQRKTADHRPGRSGLLALDWWNGNRSVLMDAGLSGLLVGATLNTRPEEIYRALVEATGFGTRVILDAFEKAGFPVDRIVCAGGLAEKSPLLMQIYADITGRSFQLVRSAQAGALGSAIYGAVAAGKERGGYATLAEAAGKMGGLKEITYRPNAENRALYARLYSEYVTLHDYFGRTNLVMHRLKEMARG